MARTAIVITPELEAYQGRIIHNIEWLITKLGDKKPDGNVRSAARKAEIDPGTLERTLDGITFPGLPTLVALGRAYDINPGEFFLAHAEFKEKAGSEEGLRPFEVAQPSAREVLRAIVSEQSPVAAEAGSSRSAKRFSSNRSMSPAESALAESAGQSRPTKPKKGTIEAPGPLLISLVDLRKQRGPRPAQIPQSIPA